MGIQRIIHDSLFYSLSKRQVSKFKAANVWSAVQPILDSRKHRIVGPDPEFAVDEVNLKKCLEIAKNLRHQRRRKKRNKEVGLPTWVLHHEGYCVSEKHEY